MKQYRYIGNDAAFFGCTALGREIDGHFNIQVDQFEHGMSHGWHPVKRHEWKAI